MAMIPSICVESVHTAEIVTTRVSGSEEEHRRGDKDPLACCFVE